MAQLDDDSIARVFAKSMYASTFLEPVVVGIHLFMTLYGLSVFLGTRSDLMKRQKPFIVISFILAVLVTFNACFDAISAFEALFKSTSSSDLFDFFERNTLSWQQLGSEVAFNTLVFVADSILVYRCYVIWKDVWWVPVLPVLTCVSALALGFAVTAKERDLEPSTLWISLSAAQTCLSVLTNVFVTSMIVFRLIRARCCLSKALPSHHLKLYTGVVAVLVESALPPSIFGIMYAAICLYTPKQTTEAWEVYVTLSYVFWFLFYASTSLSPQIIIFRVTTGRSWVSEFPKADEQRHVSGGIVFAPPGTESSFLQSVINRDLGRPESGQDDV